MPVLCAGALGVLLGLSACGPKHTSTKNDDDGGTGGGGGTGAAVGNPSSASEFFDAEGHVYCARLFRCVEGNDDFSSARLVLETKARCEQLLASLNTTGRDQRDLTTQVASGALHFVPDQAQKCLADLGRCNGANSFDDGPCREVFEGSAATGEPCQRNEDCAGDAFCQVGDDCPGTCTPRKQEGEACLLASECAYQGGATRCNYDMAGNGTCHSLAASPPAAKGQPCTRRLGTQESLVICQDGFWCATVPGGNPNDDAMGECAEPIAASGACFDGDDVCSEGICDSDTAVCRKLTLRKNAGESCGQAVFAFCDPILGLLCGDDGTCQGSGDGSNGAKCFTSDFQLGCSVGLFCQKAAMATSSDPGVCTPLLTDGAACETDSGCVGGGCVNGVCMGRGCRY